MTDNITPIRAGVASDNPVKQQMLDHIAEIFDRHPDPKPVAVAFTFVGPTGGATTGWVVGNDHEHQTSLYLARAQQIMQIDFHEYQISLCEDHR